MVPLTLGPWVAPGRSPAPSPSPSSPSPLLLVLLLLCLGPSGSEGNTLKLLLQKREASAPAKTEVSVGESQAKEFLSSLKRQKRQLWDRTQPDVQQWYQQFLYLGFDEAKFEDDVTYWTNRGRDSHDYYGGFYQRHYDEDAAIGPQNPHTFRHGASVNYDDY
ncbi:augurin isoform X2 [Ornithorhynchus anatinus]|uniref:ECRG4 augurin n=1 Tax=Ornithorhynchus anatinus TaxID=9258 RepID=A0A6I8NTI0_ORNAN|nr:augurin isoform X2 [Ornithorhynchus anatinus]